MQDKTWTLDNNKARWGDGPWANEPDRVQFTDQATGYPILLRRTDHTGCWCGYVGIPKDHPYFQKTDDKHTPSSRDLFMKLSHDALKKYGGFSQMPEGAVPDVLEQHPDYEPKLYELDCHGGVTYTGAGTEFTKEEWLKWRSKMLSRLPEAEYYPNGDAARDWREWEREVNDCEAWIAKCKLTYVCLELEPSDPEYWFVGFDCAHASDLMPALEHFLCGIVEERAFNPRKDIYRGLGYVRACAINLAKQLHEIARLQALSELTAQAQELQMGYEDEAN